MLIAPQAMKGAVSTSAQPVLLILIGPFAAGVGTVAVICVSLLTVKLALKVLNLTFVTPVKPVPVIVTSVPLAPLVGLKLLTVGQINGNVKLAVSASGQFGLLT